MIEFDDTLEEPCDESLVAINPADVRLAAMNLLARREHTRRELHRKLKRRFPDDELLASVIEQLTDENLQSDERFAESFVRQRANRGYGPARVRLDMREKGLSDDDISLAMEEADIDWYQLAQEVLEKKYGLVPIDDIKDKAKRVRFMQYRGFSSQHYQHLLD